MRIPRDINLRHEIALAEQEIMEDERDDVREAAEYAEQYRRDMEADAMAWDDEYPYNHDEVYDDWG